MGATIIILAAAIGIQIAEQRQEEATMRELEANPVRQQPAERRLDEAPMWELETELERQQQAELEALVQFNDCRAKTRRGDHAGIGSESGATATSRAKTR